MRTGVKQAPSTEMDFNRKMKVYTKVPTSECIVKTGQKPTGVRRVETDKGDRMSPNYRYPLVAKGNRQQKDDDLCAATPSTEAFRVVVSPAVTGSMEKTVMINGVRWAYVYALCDENKNVELCESHAWDQNSGEDVAASNRQHYRRRGTCVRTSISLLVPPSISGHHGLLEW